MKRKLVREQVGEEVYEYYSLGKYIVSAPRVCGGRPTFKHTRIEVAGILDRLAAGHLIDEIVTGFQGRFSQAALEEAVVLAAKALVREAKALAREPKLQAQGAMIVLDEQLHGYALPELIGRWYRSSVVHIQDLRPGTLIPDEAIPAILRAERQPVLITINVADFWRRMSPDRHFGLICFPLLDRDIAEIPDLLRRLFTTEPFRTRRSRLGKIARVSRQHVQYYTCDSWAVHVMEWDD